jgi:Flp pilus assembly protein CpaB
MRRGRIFLYLLLILVIGVVLVAVVFQQLLKSEPPMEGVIDPVPTQVVDLVDVVFITQKVSRGQVLNEAVVGLVPYQREYFIEGMVTSAQEALNQRARYDLEPGTPLYRNMLADTAEDTGQTGSDAALLIPRGMVSVSIPISRLSSVSYGPQHGDHVNVIVTLMLVQIDDEFQTVLPNLTASVFAPGNTAGEDGPRSLNAYIAPGTGSFGRTFVDNGMEQTFYLVPSEPQRPRLVSQTLIQDVIVLQVGNFKLPGETQQVAATPDPFGDPTANEIVEPVQPPDVITLIVSPQDAVTLNYLLYSGAKLTLALRGATDDSRVQTEAVTLQYLLEQYNIPVPIKLPYGMEPRIDALTPPAPVMDPEP